MECGVVPRHEMHARSTTRSACRMALSTISGPHTSLAPCFRANSRVGTGIALTQSCHCRETDARLPERTIGASIRPFLKSVVGRVQTGAPIFCLLAGGGGDGEQDRGRILKRMSHRVTHSKQPCRCANGRLVNKRAKSLKHVPSRDL